MFADLPNTLNMCLRPIENFLEALEVREFGGNSMFFRARDRKNFQKILMMSHVDFVFCCNTFTNLIQRALCFYVVREHFTYSYCICGWYKNFFKSLWSHLTAQKQSKWCTKFELYPRHFSVKLTKCISPDSKFFWEPLWCSKFHQSLCMNVKNMKHTYL